MAGAPVVQLLRVEADLVAREHLAEVHVRGLRGRFHGAGELNLGCEQTDTVTRGTGGIETRHAGGFGRRGDDTPSQAMALQLATAAALASVSARTVPALRRPICFLCPTCGEGLLPNGKSLRCASGHAVDKAKEGHLYLMKRPAPPATVRESDEIARAARSFHDPGGFASQADAVAAEVVRALLDGPPPPDGPSAPRQLLAAGCADGVYLRSVERALQSRGVRVATTESAGDRSGVGGITTGLWGVDSGKLAVRYAAKRQPSARFAVAPPHALPFADGVFDLVFSAFAPSAWDE
jgi:hypothetical protein